MQHNNHAPASVYKYGLVIDQAVLESHPAIKSKLATLLQGQFETADLDKKTIKKKIERTGVKIHSIRLNDADRLLLTFTEVDDKPVVYVFELVRDHDYDHSIIGKKGKPRLKPAIENMRAIVFGDAASSRTIMLDAHNEAGLSQRLGVQMNAPGEPLCFANLQDNFSHDEEDPAIIEFSDDQLNAVYVQTPGLVQGSAGAGKTLSGLARAAVAILENDANEESRKKILYVTKSKYLVQHTLESWRKSEEGQRYADGDSPIEFCDYNTLIKNVLELEQCQGRKPVDEDEDGNPVEGYFEKWLKGYMQEKGRDLNTYYAATNKTSLSKQAMDKRLKDFMDQQDIFYSECGLIDNYDDLNDYEKDINRQSVFKQPAERKWLRKMYEAYCRHLEQTKQFDAHFIKLTPEQKQALRDKFALVLVDEAQDLFDAPPRLLRKIANRKRIIYYCDHRQRTKGRYSNQPTLSSLVNTKDPLHYVCLKNTYRCSKTVTEFVNNLLKLTYKLTDGKQHSEELTEIYSDQERALTPQLAWVTPDKLEANRRHFAALQYNMDVAVIVLHEDQKALAAEELGIPPELIWTANKTKGLTFRDVLIYRPFSSQSFLDAAQKIKTEGLKPEEVFKIDKVNRPKIEYDHAYPDLQELLVAITRSQGSVTFYDDDNDHKNKAFIQFLKASANNAFYEGVLPHLQVSPDPILSEPILIETKTQSSQNQNKEHYMPIKNNNKKKKVTNKDKKNNQQKNKKSNHKSIPKRELTEEEKKKYEKTIRRYIVNGNLDRAKYLFSVLHAEASPVERDAAFKVLLDLLTYHYQGYKVERNQAPQVDTETSLSSSSSFSPCSPTLFASTGKSLTSTKSQKKTSASKSTTSSSLSTPTSKSNKKKNTSFVDVVNTATSLFLAYENSGIDGLLKAISQGKTLCVKLMLENNPQLLDMADTSGDTALHVAAQFGFTDILEVLLEAGARAHINATNARGDTPLHVAANNRQVEAVLRLLQEPSIDVNIQTREKTALDLAYLLIDGNDLKSLPDKIYAKQQYILATMIAGNLLDHPKINLDLCQLVSLRLLLLASVRDGNINHSRQLLSHPTIQSALTKQAYSQDLLKIAKSSSNPEMLGIIINALQPDLDLAQGPTYRP